MTADAAEAWAVLVEGDCPALVIENAHEYAVTVEPPAEVVFVTVGEQGPPGKPGEGVAEWQANDW